jgi:hypothetical protein
MPRVGFEPTIPVFDRAKTVHALHSAVIVIGYIIKYHGKFVYLLGQQSKIVWPFKSPRNTKVCSRIHKREINFSP